jgi:predicted ribosome quality control (RQC) complex YloA/Tae2 family protein
VRYPELSSLNFEPETGLLTIAFCVRSDLQPEQVTELRGALAEVLEAYRGLIGAPAPTTETLHVESMESITVVTVVRDVESLTVEEVGLTIEMLRDAAGQDLVADPNDLIEEELMAQEETIEATLESLKNTPGGTLLALREEGRILVFNT